MFDLIHCFDVIHCNPCTELLPWLSANTAR